MTDSLSEVVQSLVNLLAANVTLGLKDVYYGDENLIPRTPAVSVDADSKTRELYSTSQGVMNTFTVIITIYHAQFGKVGVTRRECDQKAEAVEDVLHANRTLNDGSGDKLVHSYVRAHEPGYATRGNTVMIASRLTWEGKSRTRL